MKDIEALVGKTLASVTVNAPDNDRIEFECTDGSRYLMWHNQDCCESVSIEDVCGDWGDLIGSPVVSAYESSSDTEPPEGTTDTHADDRYRDSYTWTFYRITTAKGQVVIRWYGTSNGYYSESVEFCCTKEADSL